MNKAADNGLGGLDIAAAEFARQLGMLAHRLGAPAAARRAGMRAAEQLIRAQARGDVCMLIQQLLGGEFKTLAEVRAALLDSALVCDGRDSDAELRPLVLDQDERLYLARYYAFERRVAQGIQALARTEQLTIISGGPGTGKTTLVIHKLTEALEQTPTLRVALAAPTGKAAQRLLEALAAHAAHLPAALAQHLPRQSFTLHRLLGAQTVLPYDWVIVDEASMVDVALAAQLVSALAPHTRLILLGDQYQLAAVEAGAVFAELATQPAHTDALNTCIVQLKHNYRFGADSVIGRLAQAVCAGRPLDALAALPHHEVAAAAPKWTDASSIFWIDDAETLSDTTLEYLAAGFEPYIAALSDVVRAALPMPDLGPLFDALNRYRVLAAFRFGLRGIDALNVLLASYVRARVCHSEVIADGIWFAGRLVMVTRNDYTLGLFNGDMGIALPTAHGTRVFFQTPDGGARVFSPAVLPPHETAFALTVHKSQGAEFDQVAFVLPAAAEVIGPAARPLTRELVYTAVTRARQSVTIFGAPEVLARAIETPTVRMQGLAARLRKIAGNQSC